MAKIIISFLSLFSVCLVAADYIPQLSKRIVGGEYVEPTQIPFQVQLRIFCAVKGETTCGGSIISESTVLSAAHCFTVQQYQYALVVAGQVAREVSNGYNNRNPTHSRQVRRVSQFKNHPAYRYLESHNDIAVIKLDRKFEFNRYIDAIALNVGELSGNINTFVSGWGEIRTRTIANINESTSQLSDRLKIAQVWTMPYQTCSRMHPGLQLGALCAVNQVTQEGFCKGDSGGPLTYRNNNNNILVGVIAVILNGCGQRNSLQLVADVSKHISFIREHARNENIKYANINTAANQFHY